MRFPGLRRRAADERGHTMVEVLVAAVIGLLVAAAGMVVLQIAVKTQPQASERAEQIQQGRALLETVSRELRQGQSVDAASANGFEVLTYVNSTTCGGPPADSAILCSVTYACAGDSCTRTEHSDASTGSPEVMATGLLSAEVFSFCEAGDEGACSAAATNPTYVGVELVYPADDGGESVTLADGVSLRNFVEEAPET